MISLMGSYTEWGEKEGHNKRFPSIAKKCANFAFGEESYFWSVHGGMAENQY